MDTEAEFHRTLVQLLIDSNNRELASAMIDGVTEMIRDEEGYPHGLTIDVPTSAYDLVSGNPALKQTLIRAAKTVATGHFHGQDGEPVIRLRVRLLPVEDGWQSVSRDLIVNFKGNNQGMVSEKLFQRQHKNLLNYNEASYASQSEIRIAQELEERQVLFFPLALGIRADTGEAYRDHREADFLVCDEGTWGILEVSYHPDRFEKDAEKDAWFKKSGVLCVQHYSAERCYRESAKVTDEFLAILRKHKR